MMQCSFDGIYPGNQCTDDGNHMPVRYRNYSFLKHGLIMQLWHSVGQGYLKKVSGVSLLYHQLRENPVMRGCAARMVI